MAEQLEFTRNYSDLSTEKGFQFEFFCNRCGNGYRTRFHSFALGQIGGAVDTANSIFGGIFGRAANVTEQVRSSNWEKAHDEAFLEAAKELKPDFIQCPRCSNWVCKKNCWNDKKGLCKQCSPDLGVEMAAAQSSRTVEEIWAHSKMAEDDRQMLKDESWREGVRATCPNCGVALEGNVKFCPDCGAKIKADAFCTECGAKLPAGSKFCQECGAKAPDSK